MRDERHLHHGLSLPWENIPEVEGNKKRREEDSDKERYSSAITGCSQSRLVCTLAPSRDGGFLNA